jgi:hypothetical protein
MENSVEALARGSAPPGQTLLVLCKEDAARGEYPKRDFRIVKDTEWSTFDLASLPDADAVILDGCLADMLAVSTAFAADAFARLLSRYRFIVFDLCSWTEGGDAAAWRSSCEPVITSDPGLRRRLVGDSACFKLGKVPTNGGIRTVYKTYGGEVSPRGLVTEAIFQRNHASWPLDKRLVNHGSDAFGHDAWAEHVTFRRDVSIDGDRYWIKTYTHADGQLVASIEQEIGARARDALENLGRLQPPRAAMLDLVLPIRRSGASLLFPFDPDIFSAGPCHMQDWSHFLQPDILRSVSIFAATVVAFHTVPSVFLHNLCDFQIVDHGAGASVLDFEPNPWVVQLLGGRDVV